MALEVVDLVVDVEGKRVIDRVSLEVERGRIVALMGPNGSGKTSLVYAIMGHPRYEVVSGDIILDGESIKELPTHKRVLKGVMLGFQNPVEVPGVKLSTLIIAARNKLDGKSELLKIDPSVFSEIKKYREIVGVSDELLYREANVGFSGGEKKRAEILQIVSLRPKYILLDEPDSGLDVDGVRDVARAVETLREDGRGILIITHYARILEFLEPDEVLVLVDGRIVDRGGPELARRIEREGYEAYLSHS